MYEERHYINDFWKELEDKQVFTVDQKYTADKTVTDLVNSLTDNFNKKTVFFNYDSLGNLTDSQKNSFISLIGAKCDEITYDITGEKIWDVIYNYYNSSINNNNIINHFLSHSFQKNCKLNFIIYDFADFEQIINVNAASIQCKVVFDCSNKENPNIIIGYLNFLSSKSEFSLKLMNNKIFIFKRGSKKENNIQSTLIRYIDSNSQIIKEIEYPDRNIDLETKKEVDDLIDIMTEKVDESINNNKEEQISLDNNNDKENNIKKEEISLDHGMLGKMKHIGLSILEFLVFLIIILIVLYVNEYFALKNNRIDEI